MLLERSINNNSIGSIFALKAIYQYSETQTLRMEGTAPDQNRLSIDELDAIVQEDAPPQLETVPEDLPTAED